MEHKTQEDVVRDFVEWSESDFGKEVFDREAAYIWEELKDYDKILDVGCGMGSIEARLPDMNIIGLDISEEMLKEARKRSQKKFVMGKAEDLPFQAESFDAVFSLTTIEFIEQYEKAIDEIVRVLGKNGKFLALLLNPASVYFKAHASKADSYFRKFKHEPQEVERYARKYFELESEYILGIQGEEIFSTDDAHLASLYVLKGQKR